MAVFSTLKFACVSLAVAGTVSGQSLVPKQDINLPASSSAAEPLQWLGANSPWFAGPNVHGISSDVPEGCTVEQAAYVVRHGSRYPDGGAYQEWVALYNKIQAAQFTATGSLSFLASWKPVLTNPTLQIAQESVTGYKEAYDMGYALRMRYPDFYKEGSNFMVWSNLYTRVVQTARMFVVGYLGPFASTLGNVISVNSKNQPLSTGNSLAPSDSCPNFVDANGGTNVTIWDNIYLPPITARLNALLGGNLTLTASDVSIFPYLCGFESQITGKLSPWCGVFTDDELKQYEYRQDLRYYYGVGPGTGLPKTMFLPFLDNLVKILEQGPGVTGTQANGTSFTLPNLLMAFVNDGQLTELVAASGVFDDQEPLPADHIPESRTYITSNFVSMRGTIAFERLNCRSGAGSSSSSSSSISSSSATSSGSSKPSASSSISSSSAASSGSSKPSGSFSNSTTSAGSTAFQTSTSSSAVAGASSASTGTNRTVILTTTVTRTEFTSCASTALPSLAPRALEANQTFIRILLNDAVYPVSSCQDGPGRSCLLRDYASLVAKNYAAAGNWASSCSVTVAGAPSVVQGASFFTDLTLPFLANVAP